MARPEPRDECNMLIRQRTPRMVRDISNERRSRKTGQCASPRSPRARAVNVFGAMISPETRNSPRTRSAAGIPASRCRSLAPLPAARLDQGVQFHLPHIHPTLGAAEKSLLKICASKSFHDATADLVSAAHFARGFTNAA